MQFEIDSFRASDLGVERFLEDYYLPEKPVLLTGVNPPEEQYFWKIARHQKARQGFGFIGAPLDHQVDHLITPDIVSAVLERGDVVTRKLPVRAWMNPKHHRTFTHYDGNSLHGLNWQITGAKRWTLISPDTPPALYPFSYFAMTHEPFRPDGRKHDFCEFDCKVGDLLFLPRYWCHAVTSLEDRNINLNWVVTPRAPNLDNLVGRRECGILRWRDLIPQIDRIIYQASSIHNYAEGGEEMFQAYAKSLSNWQLLRVLMVEIASLALLPLYRSSVRQGANNLDRQSDFVGNADS